MQGLLVATVLKAKWELAAVVDSPMGWHLRAATYLALLLLLEVALACSPVALNLVHHLRLLPLNLAYFSLVQSLNLAVSVAVAHSLGPALLVSLRMILTLILHSI